MLLSIVLISKPLPTFTPTWDHNKFGGSVAVSCIEIRTTSLGGHWWASWWCSSQGGWHPVVGEQKLPLKNLVLLIHVLHVAHPDDLKESTVYAREIVDGFFRKYTRIDVSYTEQHVHKFRHLNVDSR